MWIIIIKLEANHVPRVGQQKLSESVKIRESHSQAHFGCFLLEHSVVDTTRNITFRFILR
jgi:hypothetical protein